MSTPLRSRILFRPSVTQTSYRIDPGFVHRMALESTWFFFERVTDLEVNGGKAVQNIIFYVVHPP